jgi:hypothetical protein
MGQRQALPRFGARFAGLGFDENPMMARGRTGPDPTEWKGPH